MRSRDIDVYRITSAQPGPTAEQLGRERIYLAMMFTRMAAIVVAVLVPGYWRVIAIIAGVGLPYIAVVLVNAVHTRDADEAQLAFHPNHKPELSDRPAPHPDHGA